MLNALDGATQLLFVATSRGLSSVPMCRRVQDSSPCSQGEAGAPSAMGVLSQSARKGSLSLVEVGMLLEGLQLPHTKMGIGIQGQGSDAETSAWE